jgi:hypothetical protein
LRPSSWLDDGLGSVHFSHRLRLTKPQDACKQADLNDQQH